MAYANKYPAGTAPRAFTAPLVLRSGIGTGTLAGHVTLTHRDSQILALDPGTTARDVTLPAGRDGAVFVITNTGTAAATKNITVKNAAGTALEQVQPGHTVIVAAEGATWSVISSSGPEVLADPGNAGAIPVTRSGVCAITTTGAQTRTLAVPLFAGQRLTLYMTVDAGDCVITSAQGINAAGNTSITMNDAGDHLELVAIDIGGAMRWRVVVNNGCTLA